MLPVCEVTPPTSPSFCHACKSVRSSLTCGGGTTQCTCQLHKNMCRALSIFLILPSQKLCWCNQITLSVELCLAAASSTITSITYRKLINTSTPVLVPAKNEELCGCQDYLSVNQRLRLPDVRAVH